MIIIFSLQRGKNNEQKSVSNKCLPEKKSVFSVKKKKLARLL